LSGWKSEVEFVDFIDTNAPRIATELIGCPYESHRREWYLNGMKVFGANSPRKDLMITTQDGKRHGIECKFPRGSFSELSRSMSQLIANAAILEAKGYPLETLWLFSTTYNDVLRLVIERYNLPIRVALFSRENHAKLIHG
jgi:hypothetical protein